MSELKSAELAAPDRERIELDSQWAKSPPKDSEAPGESLPKHTMAVVEQVVGYAALRPGLAQRLAMDSLWDILARAAILHDLGKIAPGFQEALRQGHWWPHRHEVLSLAFLDWLTSDLDSIEQTLLAAAVASHHKDAPDIHRRYPLSDPDFPEDDPLPGMVAELDEAVLLDLWDWLDRLPTIEQALERQGLAQPWLAGEGETAVRPALRLPPLPERSAAISALKQNGASAIRRRLDSFRRLAKRIKTGHEKLISLWALTLRGCLMNADHAASAHAGPPQPPGFTTESILERLTISREDLYAHQVHCAAAQGSVLLTAPTGSGKTEAALLWAARQASSPSGLPRLFYTLPYQASMNAMKLRLEWLFPGRVGLQHGRSLLSLYRLLLDQDRSQADARRQAKWERDLALLHHPPIRIFSPYQMLRAMYRLKGYEAVLADYHDAAFVVDEIHAYEVERLAMILGAIRYLSRSFGARFLVMSATFPALIRQKLCDALDSPMLIQAGLSLYRQFTRHHLHCIDSDLLSESLLERIAADTRSGRSVLVACNTVNRAQQAFQHLCRLLEKESKSSLEIVLLHGRFNMRDRSEKEKLIRQAAGSQSGQRRSILLVATQVVEVSLDIDLDTIYSDPAPLEALIQRFGRINRRRSHPGPAPVHVCRATEKACSIYDAELIAATLAILDREDGRSIDESAVGSWLDEIYSGALAQRWLHSFDRAAALFEDTCIRTLHPFEADEGLEELFNRAFDTIEVIPESLAEEYWLLRETDPILAGELTVPVTWKRFKAMTGAGLVRGANRGEPPVVGVSYSNVTGLLNS